MRCPSAYGRVAGLPVVRSQAHREPGLACASVANEKDFGVRVLDLVRRRRQGCRRDCVRARLPDGLRKIPRTDNPVVVSRNRVASIGGPCHPPDRAGVAFKDADAVPSLDIPQPQRSVQGSRECVPLIGAPGHTGHGVRMARENAQAAPSLYRQQPNCVVIGRREDTFLIGTPSNADDPARMTFEYAQTATSLHIP